MKDNVWTPIEKMPKTTKKGKIYIYRFQPSSSRLSRPTGDYINPQMYSLNGHAGSRVCTHVMRVDCFMEE